MLVLNGRWVGITLAISQHLILSVIDTELYTQVNRVNHWAVACRPDENAVALSTAYVE